jgi:5,6-dimethylbenzimidazole synthase
VTGLTPIEPPPVFDDAFRDGLETLLRWRRDVRRFRTDPVAPGTVDRLLGLADLAPSVGNSQPWRFVAVESTAARAAVRANFTEANADALGAQPEERRHLYASLKLAGLDRAPVQLAVFTDTGTAQGHGLGRRTMPQTLEHSTVMAVHTLWLAARAGGIGVGWVSILDPDRLRRDLAVPEDWSLTAYLCLGRPEQEHVVPELERAGWQARTAHGRDPIRR